ncbi:hypothetical protein SKAU_G00255580 [Synaphobranchus kaupii]|uniref:Uncharacterized protein n=1 Tax=Synaphobranchus kaupii TaxID=118154 RepID=A0A9Q1F3N9_SYNKA|nr:hypothetical protein SKAU_G00255580 [Synaphobranchus kaupii]
MQTKIMAIPLFSGHLLLVALQLSVLHHAYGGAYYGHKPIPQQHQPMPQLPHMTHGKEGLPQQYLVKELPHLQYSKDIPMIPQYRKDYLHMPMHKGKDMLRKEDKGETVSRGEKGVPGDVGPQGPPGAPGLQGGCQAWENQGAKGCQGSQGSEESLAIKGHLDCQVYLDLKVTKEMASQDCQGQRGLVDHRVPQDQQGHLGQGNLAEMGFQGCQEGRENQALPESQEWQDHQVKKDHRGHQGCQAMAKKARMGCQDNWGLRVTEENKAHQGCQGAQASLELESRDFPDQKATKVTAVYLVLQAQRVTKVMEAYQGNLAPQETLDLKVHPAQWGHQGVLESQGQKARVAQVVQKGKRVLLVSQVPLGFQENLGFQVNWENRAHVVHLGPWAQREKVAKKDCQVLLEQLGCQVQREMQEFQLSKVNKALRVFQEPQVLVDPLGLLAFLDQKVSLVHLVHLASQVKAYQGFKALKGPQENLARWGPVVSPVHLGYQDRQARLAHQASFQTWVTSSRRWAQIWTASRPRLGVSRKGSTAGH